MSRSLRKFVTAPNGHRYPGRWPQQMPQKGEGPFISALAKTVGGACEVVLPLGRADVATDSTIFEVEPVKTWRTGFRQVLAYAAQTGQKPAIALFGTADYLPIFLFVRDRMPGATLWVYRGHWVEVTSRRAAVLKHRAEHNTPPKVGEFASVSLPPVHQFDAAVSADVTDPFERVRLAEFAERAHLARVAFEKTKRGGVGGGGGTRPGVGAPTSEQDH